MSRSSRHTPNVSRVIGRWLIASSIVGITVAGACAQPKGAIMLAINTDMRAPKDVNAVSVSISTNGAIKHSFIGRVTPQGEVLLPATLAITEPDDKSATIRIRVIAFQDRKPRVMRDIRTTVPSGGRTALLRVPLNFVNDASAVGEPLPAGVLPEPLPGTGGTPGEGGTAPFDFFGAFHPPCDDIENQTIIDGECKDSSVDAESLPDFTNGEQQLGNSTEVVSCFNLAKCFSGPGPGVTAVTIDLGTCTVQLNGADPARLNFAMVTPDSGECLRPGECYVPIDRGASGWDDGNGRVQLPRFVCALLDKKNLRLATSTDLCAAKLESNPICTPKVGEVLPNTDAATPIVDAAMPTPDGGPPEKTNCMPGERVIDDGGRTGDRTCAPCANETFSATTNAPSCAPWATCNPGTRVTKAGSSTANRECAACAIETFSATPNASDCAAWGTCTPGNFVSTPGSATANRLCTTCPAGLTTTTNNAAVCVAPTALQVVVGSQHTCARLTDGSVRCWGYNLHGQLGDGTTTTRFTPTAVPGLVGVTDIAAGDAHTCARLTDGSVRCWGANDTGEIGDGTTTERLSPTIAPGLAGVTDLVAGYQHNCARLADGTVRCWGYNWLGQIGDGSAITRLSPVAVVGLAGVAEMGAGAGDHNCARFADGTVQCWGGNSYGGLGDGTTTSRPAPTLVPALAGVTDLGVGYLHTCVRVNDGTVRCWGQNASGNLGDGSTTNRLSPIVVPGLAGVINLASGHAHTCARLNDGTVMCWGLNNTGQLGDNTATTRLSPTAVPGLAGVTDLAASGQHSCARLSDGSVRCWGLNDWGQIGDGTMLNRYTPTLVTF